MKAMKKVAAVFSCLMLAAALAIPAMAAGLDTNKQKALEAMSASVTVNGKNISLPADLLTQVENYLKRDDVTISDAQVAVIQKQADAAREVVKESGATSIKSLSASDKAKILELAQGAAKAVDLTVSVNSVDNTITVLDKSGTVVAAVEPVLKVTGPDTTVMIVLGGLALILLAGCAAAAFKARLMVK